MRVCTVDEQFSVDFYAPTHSRAETYGGLTSQMVCLAVLNLQLDLLLLDVYTEKSVQRLSNISEQKHIFLMQLQHLPSNLRTVGFISEHKIVWSFTDCLL